MPTATLEPIIAPPPAAKPVKAEPTPPAEPTPAPAAAAPAPTPTPEPTPAKSKKPADPIAERLKKFVATGTDPGRAEEPVAPTPAATTEPDSDDALNAEIESTTKNWAPGEKKAFTKKTYENRDLKRKVKELEPLKEKVAEFEKKIADAEAKGKDTAALQEKLAAAEAKLQAATPVDPKEIETYKEKIEAERKRREELEQELHVAAVERTEEFANAVTKPRKEIEDRVKALAEKNKINPRALQAALYGTMEEQTAAVEELTGPEQTLFYSLALKAGEIDQRAETLRTNAATALTKINEKRSAEATGQKEALKKAFTDAHAESWKELTEAVPILQPVDGDDEVTKTWNKSLTDARTRSAAIDFDALAPADRAKIAAQAAVVPNLVGALQSRETALTELIKTNAELAAKVAAFEANKPGAEVTTREDTAVDTKPQLLGAKGTAARIQAALHGAR